MTETKKFTRTDEQKQRRRELDAQRKALLAPSAENITQAPTRPIGIDFVALGQSAAIADLADAKGLSVEGVVASPELLADAGLPAEVPLAVAKRAHRMYRDRVDGMLFRCNWKFPERAPQFTANEAAQAVADAEESRTTQYKSSETRRANAVPSLETLEQVASGEVKPKVKVQRAAPSRSAWCGHSATAVVRWLGVQGLDLAGCLAALARVGIVHLSDGTVRAQLNVVKANKFERYGQPAEITADQAKQLMGS